jgi:ribosomal protein S8
LKFKPDSIELQELIAETANVIPTLRAGAIEKDYYVTQVIQALAEIKSNYFSLTFVGGTALAKAHRLVNRMSEDCDFRIQTSPEAQNLNKSQLKNQLKKFRQEILNHLSEYGFVISEENIKVRNEGNYIRVDIPYQSITELNTILRPHIQLELIAINTKLPVENKNVTTLIRQILGDSVSHTEKSIECIAVSETAADKWVALTRRVANTLHREARPTDDALIRHLFDLYYIDKKGYFNDIAHQLINEVILEDCQRYKNQNQDYYDNPIREIQFALSALREGTVWHLRWDTFTQAMTFNDDGLDYGEALETLERQSNVLFKMLTNQSKN